MEGKTMVDENVVEGSPAGEQPEAEKKVVTEEIKVQAQDLFKLINDLIREGTARRVKVIHGDRILVDIPLWAGLGSGVLMAVYMAPIAALVGVGALLGGVTVRVERDEPPA
jgi:hypothetical protein